MFKPISSSLKSHFNQLYAFAIEKADNHYNSVILKSTESLSHFDGLKYLLKEESKIDELVEADKHPYYIKNSNSEDWLLDHFANRTYLLNVNESDELVNSVYLGKLDSLVSTLIRQYKDEIPPYSYKQFISGSICEYFSFFKDYYNIPREDYYKIREWQSLNMVKIISYERIILIQNIQAHCNRIQNSIDFINKENSLLETLFNLDNPTYKELISIFKGLYVFTNFDFNRFNENDLLDAFIEFRKENNLTWFKIIPKNIQPLLDSIEKEPKTLFSNEFTLFYTLDKLKFWYENILEGKSVFEEVEEENWDLLLEQTLENAESKANSIIDEINSFCYDSTKSKTEIKKYLRDTFETYRYKFNNMEEKFIFHTLTEDNAFLLKPMFIVNSFFSNELERQMNCITESKIIHDVLWETFVIYGDIFETNRNMMFENENYGNYEIYFILNNMVPDKDIYNELDKSTTVFFREFNNYCLPMDLHFQNQRDIITNCFSKAMERLQEILNDAETTNKVLFLQTRIKELRQRELKLKMYEEEYYGESKKSNHTYSSLFKDFLIIEADYVKETSIISNHVPFISNPIKAIEPSKIETFESVINPDYQEYILTLLNDLSITVNGVSVLSERKKSSLRGIVEALKDKCLVPGMGIDRLCKIIGDKIQMEINSKLDFSTTSQDYKKKALQYIKDNPLG